MPNKFLNKLQGKTVVIVGGSAGIGYGVAEAAVEFGAKVVISSRSESRVAASVESLKKSYPQYAANIRGFPIDLDALKDDAEAQMVKLFDFATDNGASKLDHLVETAGDLALRGKLSLQTVTPELIAQAMSARITGSLLLAKVAGNYFNKEYTSSFTLTSGAMIYKPRKGVSAFLGAIGSKEPMVKGLALDMAPIRVNLVSPGAIDTELLWTAVSPEMSRETIAETYSKASILGRIGTVEDLAETYLALMKNGFQTGSNVHCNGGYFLS